MKHLGLFLVFFLPGTRCLGEDDCTVVNNISIATSPSTVFASSNDSVCFQCDFGNGVDPHATFQIENADIQGDIGTVENGILLIYSDANIFSTRNIITVSCRNGSRTILALVFLRVLLPPELNGSATVTEGNNLTLSCDASNSMPLPLLSWTDSEGVVLSNSRDLEIVNMTRDRAGVYYCVTRSSIDTNILRTPVSVTVLFCHMQRVAFHTTNNSLYWKYKHNGGCPPMKVLIEQQLGDYSLQYHTTSSGLNYGTYNISGHDLVAGTQYKFRVTAVNPFGVSSSSEMETQRVLLGVPGIPSVPSVMSSFEDIVVLSLNTLYPGVLEAPHSFGFNVTAIGRDLPSIVVYKPFPDYTNGDNVTLAVPGLKRDIAYVLTVQAVNVFGVSQFSEPSTTTLFSHITDRGDTDATLVILIANAILVVLLILCGVPICYVVYSKTCQQASADDKNEGSELSAITNAPSQTKALTSSSSTKPLPLLSFSNKCSQPLPSPPPHTLSPPSTTDQISAAAPTMSSPSISIPHSPLSPLPPHVEYSHPNSPSSPTSLPPFLEHPLEYCETDSISQPQDLLYSQNPLYSQIALIPPHSPTSLHSVPCILSSPPASHHCPVSTPSFHHNFHSLSILTTPGEEVLYEQVGPQPHRISPATSKREAVHHPLNLDIATTNSVLTHTSGVLSGSAANCSVPLEESLYETINSTKERSAVPSHQLPSDRHPYILIGCEENTLC